MGTGLNRSEWNGERAEIIGTVIEKADGSRRWPVRMFKTKKIASIKEQSLVFLSPAFLTVRLNRMMVLIVREINKLIDAHRNLPPFDEQECQIVMRSLPGLQNYFVFYQMDWSVLAIVAIRGPATLEFPKEPPSHLQEGGVALMYGEVKERYERYLRNKGVTVPWLSNHQ